MPAEAEFHRAALDMLGADAHGERVLPAHAVTYPASVIEWFVFGQLEALEVAEQRLRVAPGFYVYVDEGDDPPVYHDDEGLVSLSFSSFAFDLAAAGRLRGPHLSASGPVPDAKRLAWLGERLDAGPVTRTEDVEIHRFYGPQEYVTVRWARAGDAEWRLEAGTAEALDELRAIVDRVAGVSPRKLRRLRRRR